MYRDPLDPRIQFPPPLGRLRHVDLRLVMQTLKVGQVPLGHEPVHQEWRELVELQHHHAACSCHTFRS